MAKDGRSFALMSALTIFISAFLLFQVQPLISKFILPWFGGTPAVWTTAMLFFQTALLIGYAYAHFLSSKFSVSRQSVIHIVLLVVAALTLPIIPRESWKPDGSEAPVLRILLLLFATVGLPYIVLASTGPLIQKWYGQRLPEKSPWRLYALSNVGSLLGLLTFPFLVEPVLTSNQQAWSWSIGFVSFAVCCACVAWWYRNSVAIVEPISAVVESGSKDASTSRFDWIAWLFYPALASVMLLSMTHFLCQDVAVVPFLWVAPLALYLLSFIICFDNERWYRPVLFSTMTMVAVAIVAAMMVDSKVDEWIEYFNKFELFKSVRGWLRLEDTTFEEVTENIYFQIATVLIALFGISMTCHGELVRRKPDVSRLTAFYLTVSAGGALGGVIAAVVCPLVFDTYRELHIGLIACFLVAVMVFFDAVTQKAERIKAMHIPLLGCTVLGTAFVAYSQWHAMQDTYEVSMRNFYGVLHVREQIDPPLKRLVNGRILHGIQLTDEPAAPTTYYSPESGIGLAMEHHLPIQPRRIAVVGLGVGTLATYGKEGDVIRFYEINPDVETLARKEFSFLSDSRAEIEIVRGDARLSMEREEPQQYDVMAIDAFSSDSIPVHLMTKEAMDVFLRHLKPDGILAFHVSNRYLYLTPVVKKLADHFEIPFVVINSSKDDQYSSPSEWMLLSRNQKVLDHPPIASESTNDYEQFDTRLWTDQYSNLIQVLE